MINNGKKMIWIKAVIPNKIDMCQSARIRLEQRPKGWTRFNETVGKYKNEPMQRWAVEENYALRPKPTKNPTPLSP